MSSNGWISVKDKLPNKETYYLVWNSKNKTVEVRMFYRLSQTFPIEYYPTVREYFGNCCDYKYITHWRELPEAPEED